MSVRIIDLLSKGHIRLDFNMGMDQVAIKIGPDFKSKDTFFILSKEKLMHK